MIPAPACVRLDIQGERKGNTILPQWLSVLFEPTYGLVYTFVLLSLCLIDRASFITTLFLSQLAILLFFFYIYNFSLRVSDRLVHHQGNQITRAASGNG